MEKVIVTMHFFHFLSGSLLRYLHTEKKVMEIKTLKYSQIL